MEETGRLGSYRIDAELAHSNICTVYRAFEESLGRPVLIKKLHPQMAREEDIRTRFKREAQVCAQVKHENIVDIYGYIADSDQTMLILEFVEGLSLGELISNCVYIPWQPALAILSGVLEGLAFAHSRSVIHRDIKPGNILISLDGQAKISDFGLATLEDAPKLTRQGMVVGTPAYMPPEQITGGQIDQRSDLFSLGASFYEVLTGKSPFYADNFSEIMKKVLNAHPQRPSAVIPDIPTEFDQIVLRLIEKQPTKRYASADQALRDVKKLAEQKDVSLDKDSVREFLDQLDVAPAGGAKSSTSITEPAPLRNRRNYSTWLLGAIGVTAIVVALLLPGSRNDYVKPTPRPFNQISPPPRRGASKTVPLQPRESAGIERYSKAVEQPKASEGAVSGRRRNVSRDTAGGESKVVKPAEELVAHEPIDNRTAPVYPTPSAIDTTEPGQLFILTGRQWAAVTIDNKTIGVTPLTEPIKLAPGKHQVTLFNDQFPGPVSETVIIEPGAEQRLVVDLERYFAVIKVLSVKPWAEIFVDGVSYGETPLNRRIILPLGQHEIELRNPDFRTWRQVFNFSQGDPPVEISVSLAPLQSAESRQDLLPR